MSKYGTRCKICGKLIKIQADSLFQAQLFLESMRVCPASLHPSLPSVWYNSLNLMEITEFEYLFNDN